VPFFSPSANGDVSDKVMAQHWNRPRDRPISHLKVFRLLLLVHWKSFVESEPATQGSGKPSSKLVHIVVYFAEPMNLIRNHIFYNRVMYWQ
jgi:hypothetical protein